MRIGKITVRHFRNIGFGSLELRGSRHFFIGANGQGKTNLLEAAGYISALRSFRTLEQKLLIMTGQPTAAISCEIEHERRGGTHLMIKIHRERKELWCDQAKIPRLAEHVGLFPTVIFSSQDLQLLRGSPAGRRRWLDQALAACDPEYFRALQDYNRALEARNSLLKRSSPAGGELEAFERQLAGPGALIVRTRRAGLEKLSTIVGNSYASICSGAEPAGLEYQPNFSEPDAEALAAKLESARERDAIFGATQAGPHRDDFRFKVHGTPADDYGSEGQQRTSVLALRLAEAAWYQERSGIRPVLLADDVLGELDPARRAQFWKAVDPASQILATGTARPDASLGEWQMVSVAGGNFTE